MRGAAGTTKTSPRSTTPGRPRAGREARVVLEEPRADRHRAEVRAAAVARAHVGGDAEQHRARARGCARGPRASGRGTSSSLAGAVQAALQRELLRLARSRRGGCRRRRGGAGGASSSESRSSRRKPNAPGAPPTRARTRRGCGRRTRCRPSRRSPAPSARGTGPRCRGAPRASSFANACRKWRRADGAAAALAGVLHVGAVALQLLLQRLDEGQPPDVLAGGARRREHAVDHRRRPARRGRRW